MGKDNLIERENYIDVIAGVMIAWMVMGHCISFSHFKLPFYKFLSFYMPWFFYKSGMLFKSKESRLQLKKDANKLLRSFIVFSFIGWLVWSVTGVIDGSLGWKSCVTDTINGFIRYGCILGNGPLWFLLTLFIVRLLSNLLINKQLTPPPFRHSFAL